MSKPLHIDSLTTNGEIGKHTASEIIKQPNTWEKIGKKIHAEFASISAFLNTVSDKPNSQVVLTGAGSSAYIGDLVSGAWLKTLGKFTRAIPTTDLLTHFEKKIILSKPLLLVSFARSGNSPESKAVIDIANKKCEKVYHLIITCNPNGNLAKLKGSKNTYIFLLPGEAEDQGLAMTNSFTSMALAAILIPILLARGKNIESQIDTLAAYGEKIIDKYISILLELSQKNFNRIVFLGSGPLLGAAKESHLKVQELTDGKIIGKFDSFLGFRHGPKAIINDQTLLVYLLSNDNKTRRYEEDLVNQIASSKISPATLGISERDNIPATVDFRIYMAEQSKLDENFWAILSVLPAQIIGFYKSTMLGFNPDNPSYDGKISRVVKGVTIYEDREKTEDRHK